MPTVSLPRNAVTRYDLPAVCVATGATEGAEYRKMRFAFVPTWARFTLVFCGIFGVIAMLVTMQRVEVEVPFTDAAWAAWRRSKAMVIGLVVASCLVLVGGFSLGHSGVLLGAILFLAGIVATIAYARLVAAGLGPVCKYIDEEHVRLDIPSEEAAAAIEARLGLGAPGAEGDAGARVASNGERDDLDERLEAELARFD